MNRVNRLISLAITIFFCFVWQSLHPGGGVDALYQGIPFDARWYVVLIQYFLIVMCTLTVMGIGEKYVNGYGQYVLIRSRATLNVFKHLCWQILVEVAFLVGSKLIIFMIVLLIKSRDNVVSNLFSLSGQFLLDALFFGVLISFVVFGEIFWDSRVVAFVVQVIYFAQLFMGNLVHMIWPKTAINLLFPINLVMSDRSGILRITFPNISLFTSFFLIGMLVVGGGLVFIYLRQKDWLAQS